MGNRCFEINNNNQEEIEYEEDEDDVSNIVNITNEIFIGDSKNYPTEDYIQLKFLGEGSFAAVYKVKNRLTGETRAMKVIKKNKKCSDKVNESIINEINILKKMDHLNILKIFEFYSNKDSYSLITELCLQGELFEEIEEKAPFDEKYASFVMYQILSAINYCHGMGIIHRDIKPENILIFKRNVNGYPLIKVCDFGTSVLFEKGATKKKVVGSSYYMAPEVLKESYNEKCDLWSCGVIMYILLSGRPPFGGDSDEEVMNNVSKGEYDLTEEPFNTISKEGKDLLIKMLTFDPNKRISAANAIVHPWLEKFGSKEMFNSIKDEGLIKMFIENLKAYKSDSIIQETALAYLVHNFSQRDEIVNACKLFNQMDISGDGKINKTEFYNGLSKKLKSDTLKNDVDIIFKNIDADNNGYIQYEEFIRAAVDKRNFLDEQCLKFAFRYFDKDDSGEITYDEIEEVFKRSINNQQKVKEGLKQIINQVDLNDDGIISFEEFKIIMLQLLKRNIV